MDTYNVNYKVRVRPGSQATNQNPTTMAPAETAGPLTRTAVGLEYASLRYEGHCPLGMYVTPSVESLLIWDAVLFVHQGYYADSILKFRISFPNNYPDRPPTVQFITDVFHPLVSQQTGQFNLLSRFRPWRPKEHHIFDVLHWVKASFKKHALDGIHEADCFNKEAYRYHESTASFAALANQSSLLSQSPSALYDRDHPSMTGKGRGGIIFKDISPEQLSGARKKLGLQEWDVAS